MCCVMEEENMCYGICWVISFCIVVTPIGVSVVILIHMLKWVLVRISGGCLRLMVGWVCSEREVKIDQCSLKEWHFSHK